MLRGPLIAVVFLVSLSAGYGQELNCPASIKVTISATAPAPWKAEGATEKEFQFLRPSLYNGNPGKEEYELAPDGGATEGKRVTQTWKITDYRDMNVFLRCRYAGTAITATVNVPAEVKTCTFSFENASGNQPVTSPAFGCK